MPKICYVERKFSADSLTMVAHANKIIAEYVAMGYQLTLRQLYYQFVSRDLIPNKQTEYKRLGSIVNDARLAGLIDWEAIEDRGRNLQKSPSWDDPAAIIDAAAQSFMVDMWESQPYYVEVWVEKEALLGVIAVACEQWRVPSQSEMWEAGYRRLRTAHRKERLILHLGDHDPSGIDMTRDIRERLTMFAGGRLEIRRLALNMDQVDEWSPPPNPAKLTDSRFAGYEERFGNESWELDALSPDTIAGVISRNMAREDSGRASLVAISERFEAVNDFIVGMVEDEES